jgi:hypothetical protein
MSGHTQVLARAVAEVGLSERLPLIETLARPSVRLQAAPAENLTPGTSRIGGAPALPSGFAWPRAEDAATQWWSRERAEGPLTFLAQLNFAELAPHDTTSTLPARGSLLLFCRWNEAPCFRAVFVESDELQRAEFPDDLAPENRFSAFELKPRAEITLPRYGSHGTIGIQESHFFDALEPQVLAARLSREEEKSYDRLRAQLAGEHDKFGVHRVLGCADYVQNPMVLDAERERQKIGLDYETYLDLCEPDSPRLQQLMADAHASDWLLLAQIDSVYGAGDAMIWGDGGTHFWWIRRADLEARDFSRLFYDLQSG